MAEDMAAEDMAGRVAELEIRLAHAERTMDELGDVVARQWQVIDRLERQARHLKDQIADLEASGKSGAPTEPPPPHY